MIYDLIVIHFKQKLVFVVHLNQDKIQQIQYKVKLVQHLQIVQVVVDIHVLVIIIIYIIIQHKIIIIQDNMLPVVHQFIMQMMELLQQQQ